MFKPSSKPINKNNGEISTLEDFGINKKEGFANQDPNWNEYGFLKPGDGFDKATYNNDPKAFAQGVIDNMITPLKKQMSAWDRHHGKITTNYDSIEGDYDKIVKLRDQLNEVPPSQSRSVECGNCTNGTGQILVDVPNVDMSYQRVVAPETVDSSNWGVPDGVGNTEDVFTVTVNSKTLTITHANGKDWDYNLIINVLIEDVPDKTYFHHKEDWEFGDKRRNQREQHMTDTKELLLYTNQFYIIGSISTALALIFAYKRYG